MEKNFNKWNEKKKMLHANESVKAMIDKLLKKERLGG